MSNRIACIGGGNMAFALAGGLAKTWPGTITVAEPVAEQRARFQAPIRATADNLAAAAAADIVLLAVKPQVIGPVAREIAPALCDGDLVISIAAGVPIAALEGWLGADTALVRCMPNTPALVGAGITGLVANGAASEAHRQAAEGVMQAVGDVVWFDEERDLDAVTALSGSGPAYFFLVIEALIDAGRRLGLDGEVARRLTVATAAGAAAMAAVDDPAELRRRVTSPGGTTERALSILAEQSLSEAFAAAVAGACERSRELAEEFGKP